ncbi:FAD binding domain-containing [Fusarium albosuccineum]|uniref:FAD binding domain-containing n=1 Tax=Fusarium albosuccineum TaxID=1237068 RepID=A0A8H4LRM1_9HYPO|nr:FAD binding domain-containing [Fusarium albosuccineum]
MGQQRSIRSSRSIYLRPPIFLEIALFITQIFITLLQFPPRSNLYHKTFSTFFPMENSSQWTMKSLLWFLHATSALAGSVSYSMRADTSQALKDCLLDAVGGKAAQIKFPSDAGFQSDHVRPYNLNFPWAPFAITYPADSSQVGKIVACASENDRKVQARSGGHDYTNKCIGGGDGAVVVDLKNLKQVQVDSQGIATVGAGNRLKDVCEKLHANGKRYIPHGSSPTVGIGGHATVGGLGLHSRLLGTSIDVMTGAEVVLANGTIVQASEKDHSDLFWAIRGAGASFGIVTSFKFQTKPEPKEIVNFSYTISSTSHANLSAAFKAYHRITTVKSLDRRLSSVAIIQKDTLLISGVFFGPKSDYARLDFGSQIPGVTSRTLVTDLSWMGHMNGTFKSISDIFPDQSYFYAKDTAVTYSNLPSNSTIDAAFKHLQTAESGTNNWFVLIDLYGGAANDAAVKATSYPHRDMVYFFTVYARSDSKTTSSVHDFVEKAVIVYQDNNPDHYLSYAGYTNLRIEGRPQKKYWGTNLPRLETIKAAVDPDDVFSTPQGVKARQ